MSVVAFQNLTVRMGLAQIKVCSGIPKVFNGASPLSTHLRDQSSVDKSGKFNPAPGGPPLYRV